MLTRRRKIILYISATLLLIGIGGYFYITSDRFLEDFVRPRLIKALEEQIDDRYSMHIDHLQGNILTGVQIDDFSIDDKVRDGQTVMLTESIVLKYNVWGLLQRKLLVSSLVINTPIIEIDRGADGQLNITRIFRKKESESDTSTDDTSITKKSIQLAVSKVTLNNGVMLYTDQQRNLEFELPDIEIELKGSYEEWNHTGQFSIGEGSLSIDQSTFNFERIDDIEFSFSTEKDTLSRLKIKTGKSEIEIEETDFDRVSGEWNTFVKLTFNAEDIQKLLDEKTKIDGSGVIELDLRGDKSNISGQIIGYSEGFSYSKNPQAISDTAMQPISPIEVSSINIGASLDLNAAQPLMIDELSAVIADGSLSMHGGVSFSNTSETNLVRRLQYYANNIISFEGECKFDQVNLRSFLSMFTTLPSDSLRIENGTIEGSIQFSGDTEGNYNLDSLTRLLGVNLFVDRNTDPFISLDDSYLSFKLSADSVKGSSVNASGVFDNIHVEVEGSIENFDTRLRNVDFGKLFRIANSVPIEGVGSVNLNINSERLITGNLVIPETYFFHQKYNPIPIGHSSIDFKFIDNTFHFENGKLTHNSDKGESSIQVDGKIRVAENLPANFNIILDQFVLTPDYVRILFSEEYPIAGNIKGELVLSGELIDGLDGTGRFTHENGNVWGVNLDPGKIFLAIDDYAFKIADLMLTAREQRILFNLHVGNSGGFYLSIKNPDEKPIQLAELALASDITDFPLDGKMVFDFKTSIPLTGDADVTVDFGFSDMTFQGNPLGDAKLRAILAEDGKQFKFTGKAFADTGTIEGTIASESPHEYYLKLNSEKTPVDYFLPIMNTSLEDIDGTFNGRVEVEGTLLELISADNVEDLGARIYPFNVDILIAEIQLQYKGIHLTNPKPLSIHLVDDLLTLSNFSLSTSDDETPFIQSIGELDLKTEEIYLSSKGNQVLELASILDPFGFPITGSVYYDFEYRGTLKNPRLRVNWRIPKLVIKTGTGEILITEMKSALVFEDSKVDVQPFTMQILGNTVEIWRTH